MIQYFHSGDDELLAGQWQDSHFDEDAGWWVSVQQAGTKLALTAALLVASTTTLAAQGVFSQSQDDPAAAFIFQPAVQEEYWQNAVAPVNWPQPSAFSYDDVLPVFVSTFVPDAGEPLGLVPPVQATNYLQLPLNELEIFPQFPAATNPVDDSSVWVPNNPPWEPNSTLLFFLDDGSTVPTFQYDEDFWYPQIPSQLWPQPAQPFSDSDENNLVPQVPGEDVFWTQYVAPVAASLNWPQPFGFEQHEPVGTLVAFTDEIFWANPTPPVPASIWLLRQDAFEQTDATGSLFLDLDEGLWTNPTAPLPASLVWPQQFGFDEQLPAGGFSIIHEEDFWVNPVAPVASYPVPFVFSYDEVIESFVQVFQPDEDLWPNLAFFPPPVQARNYVLLPFMHEKETPILFPFIPPPPPFCPLPPVGPDQDTSMSVFGGSANPLKVLFCRICNSGKPLLVRADYAIWCQDCCAFVSKADTYMGTVQAPGQLKNIF